MIWQRRRKLGQGLGPLAIAAGTAAAAAAIGILVSRWRSGGREERAVATLERAVAARLEADPVLRERWVEVRALGHGIVELSGSVRTEGEAERAVAEAQVVPTVRTVVNRLDVRAIAEHLDETRRRFQEGEPTLRETHWYGQRVGMGQRRKGRQTDPGRRDESSPMIERELGADRATEHTSEEIAKTAPGVEGHTTGPAGPTDHGTVDGVRRRGVAEEVPEPREELQGRSRVHRPLKKGVQVTFEERQLERTLRRREREARERERE